MHRVPAHCPRRVVRLVSLIIILIHHRNDPHFKFVDAFYPIFPFEACDPCKAIRCKSNATLQVRVLDGVAIHKCLIGLDSAFDSSGFPDLLSSFVVTGAQGTPKSMFGCSAPSDLIRPVTRLPIVHQFAYQAMQPKSNFSTQVTYPPPEVFVGQKAPAFSAGAWQRIPASCQRSYPEALHHA